MLDTAWNLWSDTHDLVVTDIRGCTQTASVTITENTEIITNLSANSVSCYGGIDGSASVVSTNGGVMPYQYMWSTNEMSSGISNLSFGDYSVITTDAIGCVSVEEITVAQPTVLQTGVNVINQSCFGVYDGQLTAVVNGGTAPFSYQWLDGSTTLSSTIEIANGLSSSVNYQLQVTDANGCQSLAFASLPCATKQIHEQHALLFCSI